MGLLRHQTPSRCLVTRQPFFKWRVLCHSCALIDTYPTPTCSGCVQKCFPLRAEKIKRGGEAREESVAPPFFREKKKRPQGGPCVPFSVTFRITVFSMGAHLGTRKSVYSGSSSFFLFFPFLSLGALRFTLTTLNHHWKG